MRILIKTTMISMLISNILGCATYGGGIDINSLSATSKTNEIEVTSEFEWSHTSIFGVKSELRLKKGLYKPFVDDRNGTYYEGEELCLNLSDDTSTTEKKRNCGLYVPNKISESIIVYFYPNLDVANCRKEMSSKGGLIIGSLASAECDNIVYLKEQPDSSKLKSAIKFID